MDVLMPQLGETVDEGTVAQWHKKVGEHVELDEILLDVETDKASMEIPAPAAGTLKSIRVETGQTVTVGTVLAVIDSADGAADDADNPSDSDNPTEDSDQAGRHDDGGDDSDQAGRHDDRDDVGKDDGPADESQAGASAPAGRRQNNGVKPQDVTRGSERRLSPAVRRLVAENDLAIDRIAGSGRNGRITRRDVLEHLAAGKPDDEIAAGAGATAAKKGGDIVPFNRIRRLTADHMVRSRATSPHVLQAVEVDFSAVQQIRNQMREPWRARHQFSLTWLPFIAHAVCRALAQFPHLNASVEDNGLRLHPQVNLAIAVDLGPDDGLVAPVIRNAGQLSVEKLAHAIHELSGSARAGRLKPDDLSGGTYTLSNSGSFGTLITAPIINQPQVAILSTDGIRKRPVVLERPDGDALAIRPVGILAQSFDHRAVDGAYSAAFLAKVRTLIEQSNWTVEI